MTGYGNKADSQAWHMHNGDDCCGILVCGLNGCGKTTLGRLLAERLQYRRMDVEDYFFPSSSSGLPYADSRSRKEVERLLLEDILRFRKYVLSCVGCGWGEEILSTLKFAVYLSAPLDVRLDRILSRERDRFGDRVLQGGDMYESQRLFHAKVSARREEEVTEQLDRLNCPILCIDARLPLERIVGQVLAFHAGR